MTALSPIRSRSEVLTDVRAKRAAAARAVERAKAAENWATALWWLKKCASLDLWISELTREAA